MCSLTALHLVDCGTEPWKLLVSQCPALRLSFHLETQLFDNVSGFCPNLRGLKISSKHLHSESYSYFPDSLRALDLTNCSSLSLSILLNLLYWRAPNYQAIWMHAGSGIFGTAFSRTPVFLRAQLLFEACTSLRDLAHWLHSHFLGSHESEHYSGTMAPHLPTNRAACVHFLRPHTQTVFG